MSVAEGWFLSHYKYLVPLYQGGVEVPSARNDFTVSKYYDLHGRCYLPPIQMRYLLSFEPGNDPGSILSRHFIRKYILSSNPICWRVDDSKFICNRDRSYLLALDHCQSFLCSEMRPEQVVTWFTTRSMMPCLHCQLIMPGVSCSASYM